MAVLPIISGKDSVSILEQDGFEVVRIKGSHFRMKHPDGRITTVPVHKNEDLPKGLLRKILRNDIQYSVEEFNALIKERQREGIELAKQRGAYKGRKPLLSQDQRFLLQQQVAAGANKGQLAKELGVSRETLYHYLKLAQKMTA